MKTLSTCMIRGLLVAGLLMVLPKDAAATIYLYEELVESFENNNEDLRLTGWGSAEDAYCADDVRVTVRIHDPTNYRVAGDLEEGFCYVETSVDFVQPVDNYIDGEWEVEVIGVVGSGERHACAQQSKAITTFTAIFQYSHFNSLIQKHEYVHNISLCNGTCQPDRWCSTISGNYAFTKGAQVSAFGFTYCKNGPMFVVPNPPACKQTFGFPLGGFESDCN